MYSYKSIYVLWLYCLLAIGLQGCTAMGYGDVDIDTTRKAIVVSVAEVRGANLLLQDLIQRRAITSAQAQTAKDSLQDAADGLQVALNLVNLSGDPVTANTHLERARISISVALSLLAPLVEDNP